MTRLLYVACADDRTIRTVALDAAGGLTAIATTAVPGADQPATSLPLALSPDGTRLYAAVRTPPYPVASFAVAADGALTPLATAPLPHAMAYIVTDAAGRNLFGASYPGGLIARSAIDADGAVRSEAAQIIETPPKAHCIRPGPDGTRFYVPCLGGDVILRFRLTPDGLIPEDGTPTHAGAGPRHIVFAPDGAHAYSLNELDATIDAWLLAADGALAPLQTVPTLQPGTTGAIAGADIHLTPDGRFLYASERLTNILSAWSRDPATGLLTALGDVPSEATPRGFAIAPDGRFLICAGQSSSHITSYAIGADGGLAPVARLAVGANPNWVTFLA